MNENKITWRVHPLLDFPLKSIFLFFILIVIGYLVIAIFQAGIFLFLYLIFFFLSFSSYWFPTAYTVDEEGIHVKRIEVKFTRKWDQIKRILWDEGSFFISPFEKRTRLERTRGINILCPDKNIYNKVRSYCEDMLKKHEELKEKSV